MNSPYEVLPPRWELCPKIGKVVALKFLPMKTPLGSNFDRLLSQDLQFHPEYIFQRALENAKEGAKVGMVVDLTKTSRYYDKDEIKKNECLYKKLPLDGHNQPPTKIEVDVFINFVNEFFEVNPNDVIAVHCTHGFNRTGFLVVAYLVEELGYSVDMAVQAFADARPDGIYKQGYLDELCKRYTDEEETVSMTLTAPGRPLWENGIVNYDCIHSVSSNAHTDSVADVVHKNVPLIDYLPKFMDGRVRDVHFVENEEERNTLQEKVLAYCEYQGKRFPGSQPVSLENSPEKNNITLLQTHDYMVSWKADGVRYLVLIEEKNRIYAFDRSFNVFRIMNVLFPNSQYNRHVCNTLFDAEVVIEKVGDKDIPRMLIYDIICFEGENVGKQNFRQRFDLINNELIAPRTEALKKGIICREREPMGVRRKDFYILQATRKFFEEKFLRCLSHGIDGLIFQPNDLPYTPGACMQLLKWKPPDHITIDFKLDIQKVQRQGELSGYVGNLHLVGMVPPLGKITVTKDLKQFDKKIIECSYDPVAGQWKFIRERTDKSLPNAYETAISVINTIKYPITKQNLLSFIDGISAKSNVAC